MGMYANAEFCFGIYIEPEFDDDYTPLPPFDDEEEGFELEEFLIRRTDLRLRVKDPFEDGYHPEDPKWEAAYDKYRKEVDALVDGCPVETAMFGHCDDSEQRVILALKGTRSESGDCWSPVEFSPIDLSPYPDGWEEAIKFCDEYKLGDFRKANWLLYASYG